MSRTPKIKHVAWREGRPRFQPGPALRQAGHQGRDLRHGDGSWFSQGEALDWSNRFCAALAAPSNQQARSPRKPAQPRPVAAMTVARLVSDWQASPKWTVAGRRAYAENTRRDYRQKLRIIEDDHPLIWNAPATAVRRRQLRAMYEEIWQARGLASARGAVLALSSAFSWGVLSGRVRRDDNPALGLKMETPDPRVRFFSRTEFEAWVAAADAIGRPEIGDMAYLGVWTGQRQADRLALASHARIGKRRVFRQQKTGAIVWAIEAPELERRLEASEKRRAGARATALLAAKTPEARAAVEARFAHVVLDERRWVPFSKYHYSHLCAEVRAAAVKGNNIGEAASATARRASSPAHPEGRPEGPLAREAKQRLPCPSLADIHEADLRDTAVTWMALAESTVPEIVSVTGHTVESATRILRHYLARHPEMADSAIAKMVAWYEAGGETEIGL